MNIKSVFESFTAKLRDDKKLEILVYSALILTAVIIFAATGGISCSGSMKSEEASCGVEERLECILTKIAGAGKVSVMVSFSEANESRGEILGVIVVAEGAKSGQVRSALRTAVTTALDIGPERVGVFPTE